MLSQNSTTTPTLMNSKTKKEKIKELFESQQLVQYPSDQNDDKKFYMVDPSELMIIQEINESQSIKESIHNMTTGNFSFGGMHDEIGNGVPKTAKIT